MTDFCYSRPMLKRIAFAQTTPTPTTKADCEKATMTWDAQGGKDGKGACVAAAPAAKDATKK